MKCNNKYCIKKGHSRFLHNKEYYKKRYIKRYYHHNIDPLEISVEKFISFSCLLYTIQKYNCIGCVTECIDENFLDVIVYENNFLWFEAIEKARKDVLELFISYGAEDYINYRTSMGKNSFRELLRFRNYMKYETFIDIFHLFVAAGIPVDGIDVENNSVFRYIKMVMKHPCKSLFEDYFYNSIEKRLSDSIYSLFPIEFEEVGIDP